MSAWINSINGGTCSVCEEEFTNNKRQINIAKDSRDDKLYCKDCAIDIATNGFFKKDKSKGLKP